MLYSFLKLVMQLLEVGTLSRGGVFIVDNCTIHIKGDNVGIQAELFQNYGILIITLPPYHPDFNPTKLVFDTFLRQILCNQA